MIRYREGKIVSTKGERFSQVTKEESEEMKKSIVNMNFIIWQLLFHPWDLGWELRANHNHSILNSIILITIFRLTLHFARCSEQKIWQISSSIILIWCWCPLALHSSLLTTVSGCLVFSHWKGNILPRLKVRIISLFFVPFHPPGANINSFKIAIVKCYYASNKFESSESLCEGGKGEWSLIKFFKLGWEQ